MKKGEIVEAVCREMHYPNRGICEIADAPVSLSPEELENNVEQKQRTELSASSPAVKGISSEPVSEAGEASVEEGPVEIAVKNAIPGQRLSVRALRKKGGIWHGQALSVIEKSPLEDRPAEEVCPHCSECGGCLFQTLSYKNSLAVKNDEVHRLFEPVFANGLACETFQNLYEGLIPSPDVSAYRNKMEFSFGDSEKDGPLTLGLHQKHSFFNIINTDGCSLTHKDADYIVRATREYFSKLEITYEHKKAHEGYLRHLLFRRAVKTGEILVDLVTTSQWDSAMRVPAPQEVIEQRAKELDEWFNRRYSPKAQKKHKKPEPDKYIRVKPSVSEEEVLEGWKDMLLGLKEEGKIEGTFAGILHTINDSLADAVTDMGTTVLYGKNYFYEEILGLRFRITPFSFFQTNSLGAEKLYSKVREYAGFSELQKEQESGDIKKPVIYDLYSGTGTITQLMSSVASKAIGVEIVKEAVAAARENAELNGVTNCDFIAILADGTILRSA